MHAQRLNITFPYELAQDLRRTIPVKNRSRFIAQAVSEKLAQKKKNRNFRKELIKSLKANYDYYQQVGKEIEEDFKYADAEILKKIP